MLMRYAQKKERNIFYVLYGDIKIFYLRINNIMKYIYNCYLMLFHNIINTFIVFPKYYIYL